MWKPVLLSIGFSLVVPQVGFARPQADVPKIESLSVYPKEFRLSGNLDRLQLVVSGVTAAGEHVDLTHEVVYRLSSSVAKCSNSGLLIPLANGTLQVDVLYQAKRATSQLLVENMASQQRVSFHQHALPILARSGCSGGSCHGSPHGKGGFRLSLFASDWRLDLHSLTKDQFGRRVNLIEPSKSLILKKPTMQVAHQGGQRLHLDSPQYQLLADWIAGGCEVNHSESECVGIDIYPGENHVVTFPFNRQQLSVLARFDDGSVRDVSHLAKYEAASTSVANVSQSGVVTGLERGESAIIIRYLKHVVAPVFTFVRPLDGFRWNGQPAANYIDDHVYQKLQLLQYSAAALCSDSEFVRRVYLDVIGVLPTVDESMAFLESNTPRKREALIDALLGRPEYAKFWAQKWGDLLRASRKLIGAASVYKLNNWLEQSVGENQPYDEFVADVLLATGSTMSYPAGNYFRAAGDSIDATETTAQVFLGTRIACAKCHNHPFEKWTQDHYYGLSAFFHRVERSKTDREEETLIWSRDSGEVKNPTTGKVVTAWVPVTGEMPLKSGDPRAGFVEWLSRKDNPFLARVEVNRIWAQVMGWGIVEPFDDFRDSNPPSNPALLDALARDFIAGGYDRRKMLRTILLSNVYQASSITDRFNRDDRRYFSHRQPKKLTAEQLVDALGFVTGKPREFHGVPRGTKATWLPAPDLKPHDRGKIGETDFLKVFGQPERQSVCECERGDDASLGQALQLLNGKFLHEMLADKQNHIHRGLANGTAPLELIKSAYQRALCRQPSPEEITVIQRYLAAEDNKSLALEDVFWSLLNRNEFLFQH